MSTTTELKRTPLWEMHRDLGAKLVDFAGWEMPLHYGSILDEHRQVRSAGGAFDVSHMGRFRMRGRDARPFLDHVCTRQIAGMQVGQARYSLVCNARGGCRDDVLVYYLGEDDYMMVCNASNREKLIGHFDAQRGDYTFRFEDLTSSTAMVAVQGPEVMAIVARYSDAIPSLKRYRFVERNVLGLDLIVSRTGYTGEDGVEVIFPTTSPIARTALRMVMNELTGSGSAIRPAGLGARDSLRLEASMALYGHEIDEEIDPLSAGLDFAVKFDKGDDDPEIGTFIGQEALRAIAKNGPRERLVGLVLDSPRAARQSMAILHGGKTVGRVTSGCMSPTLARSIAMGYVPDHLATVGSAVEIDLGRATVAATVVKMPFYARE